MSYSLDTTTTDTGVTFVCPGARTLNMQVTNAPVLLAFGRGAPSVVWGPDESYLPVIASLRRREGFDAVRVKSRTAGKPATVFLTAQ